MKAGALNLSSEQVAKFLPECEDGEAVRLIVSGTLKKAEDGSAKVAVEGVEYSEGEGEGEGEAAPAKKAKKAAAEPIKPRRAGVAAILES